MESSLLESLEDSDDTPLTIGKQDLEKAFKSILTQLGNQRRPETVEKKAEFSKEKSYNNTATKRPSSNQVPSFSLSYGGGACFNNVSYGKSAPNQSTSLQINLPVFSEDPCQILITSHRDQVTIKYLQQGQQFTFSSGNCATEHENVDQVFSNVENVHRNKAQVNTGNPSMVSNPGIQNDNPFGIVIQDVVSQSRHLNGLSDSCHSDSVTTSQSCLPSIANVTSLNDHAQNERESSKRKSLNNFIDSLVDKRSREASERIVHTNYGKDLDQTTNNMEACATEVPKTTHIDMAEPGNCLFMPGTTTEDRSVTSSMVVDASQQPSMTAIVPELQTERNPQNPVIPYVAGMNKPIKKGRFKCQYCDEMFQRRSQCLLHISQQHVEERPHHCKLCDATFKKKRSLEYHLRHHDGERRFKCTVCNKAFKEKYHLTVHLRTHTGERPFECKICGKAFKQTNELTSHIRIHTGERPYKCDLCDMWFRRKPQLDSHRISHFNAIEPQSDADKGLGD